MQATLPLREAPGRVDNRCVVRVRALAILLPTAQKLREEGGSADAVSIFH
jgi:hypothetical protein